MKKQGMNVVAKKLFGVWMLLAACAGMGTVHAQTVEYIHTDALGTPVAVTDANRNVIERSEYEPYGKVLNRAVKDGPGYTGHVEDAATGLTYMQQRYYDPQIGRFLSVDPVTADPNTGASFNRYGYALNNPYTLTDPDGRHPIAMAARCAVSAPCRAAATISVKRAITWAGAAIAGAFGAREGMHQANESAEPIPGAVDVEDNLAGQELIDQVEDGEGKVLERMGEKKFDPETGTHDKVAISRKNPDGTRTELHAERNRKTGKVDSAKIKQDHSNSRGERLKRCQKTCAE